MAKLVQQYDAKGDLGDITDFQRHYLDNGGLFLVLMEHGKVVGTGAIRKLSPEVAELKRMWFLPEYRGRGLGRQMTERLLAFAREKNYQRVRLDTDAKSTAAIRLYERLGFQPIARYNDSVCDRFMELQLEPGLQR